MKNLKNSPAHGTASAFFLSGIMALATGLGLTASSALANSSTFDFELNHAISRSLSIAEINPLALVDWKVGDSADYQIGAMFGKVGTMHKEITSEEGDAVWMTQNIEAVGNRKEKVETLIDRNTGKVLKMIHNGKEEQIPNDAPEIISQEYTEVTVPAGTFKSLHIVAKTKQVKHIELWMNNKDVVMDGAIKQVMSTQFGNITLEMTQQHKTP